MRPLPIATPPNPWAKTVVEYLDLEDWRGPGDTGGPPDAQLQVFEDTSKTILSKNDSPDVGFTWSINPYRGCFHACAYCYARPGHEYLSFGAGTDFDRKIVIKPKAPDLLREAFDKPSWTGERIVFSGVTDCYQPLEASYQLTRGCLEVCAEYKQPAFVITKSPLIERDIDLMVELGKRADFGVTISIPFWNVEHARAIEPFVATPQRRMRTIEKLAKAGIPVGVNVAPIIPGLGDEDIADILHAAKDAGASFAAKVMLRLPGPVKDVFVARLRAALPLRAEKVLSRIRDVRGGRLNDSRFGVRGTGEGVYADAIAALFDQTARRLGLDAGRHMDRATRATFERPLGTKTQLAMF
jgi:DNA repair photolyase